MARPVWIVAHACNEPDEVDSALADGANAVECDVRCDDGRWHVDHGVDDGALALEAWLATAAIDDPSLALVVFDIKTAEADVVALRARVRAQMPGDLPCIYSVAGWDDRQALARLAVDLGPREGLAIDEHDDPDAVAAFFAQLDVDRAWYGMGIDVKLPEPPNVRPAIDRAVAIVDAGASIAKVLVWTLARRGSIDSYLDAGVDAVMVERFAGWDGFRAATELIRERPALRTAVREDDPFERLSPRPTAASTCNVPRYRSPASR
jgi:hypothetical protein